MRFWPSNANPYEILKFQPSFFDILPTTLLSGRRIRAIETRIPVSQDDCGLCTCGSGVLLRGRRIFLFPALDRSRRPRGKYPPNRIRPALVFNRDTPFGCRNLVLEIVNRTAKPVAQTFYPEASRGTACLLFRAALSVSTAASANELFADRDI